MCAGISFSIDQINPKYLDKYFTELEYEQQRKGDSVRTFFWQKQPFLPVQEDGDVHLYKWGNRDVGTKLPKTGWAKLESLREGRWDWLSPHVVKIPSLYGYEKKHWFKTPYGIKGIKVHFHNLTRVYMVTQKASLEYLKLTGHDRMPVLLNN